jgi:hypothetical protein
MKEIYYCKIVSVVELAVILKHVDHCKNVDTDISKLGLKLCSRCYEVLINEDRQLVSIVLVGHSVALE